MGWLQKQVKRRLQILRLGRVELHTRDVWHTSRWGHKPGDYRCPCKPFVTTDVDTGELVIRHIPLSGESEKLNP